MLGIVRRNVIDLPTNVSLSYLWCGGFMIGSFLVIQIVSGIILSFLYLNYASVAFENLYTSTFDGLFIWLVRYLHVWGVTCIFMLFFMHMGRSLYYSSYSKLGVWNVGFILYLIMMIEAFLGYILPWHQMSFWAATVISSVLQSIPLVGPVIYKYVVGGFGVSEVTLPRIFSVHVWLAFVIVGLAGVHLFYLHQGGSNNPLFIFKGYTDVITFHSFYTYKDGLFLFVLFSLVSFSLIKFPDLVLDIESYIEADPMSTPENIKPEWYFLPFYAMLRSIESKIGGLVLVAVFLFVLWLPTLNGSCAYCVVRQMVFWWSVSIFILLTYLGACHPEYPYLIICKIASVMLICLLAIFKLFWRVNG